MVADPPAPADAVPLDELVRELGPLPGPLAAGYARQAAAAVHAAREAGRPTPAVGPATLLVGPVVTAARSDGTPRRKPGPGATVALADTGPAVAGADDPRDLGAALYFLLAGRPPATPPAPLAAVRPDLPPGFADLVHRLLAPDQPGRPATAAEVADALAVWAGHPIVATPVAEAEADGAPGWSTDPFPSSTGTHPRPALRRVRTAGEKTRIWVLVVLGLVLNLAAVGLAVAWWSGALDPKPEAPPDPAPSVTPKKPDRPPRVRKAKPAEPEPDPDEVRD